MKLRNGNGDITLSPKEEAKVNARKEVKELKKKAKPKSVADLLERIEAIEKILGL